MSYHNAASSSSSHPGFAQQEEEEEDDEDDSAIVQLEQHELHLMDVIKSQEANVLAAQRELNELMQRLNNIEHLPPEQQQRQPPQRPDNLIVNLFVKRQGSILVHFAGRVILWLGRFFTTTKRTVQEMRQTSRGGAGLWLHTKYPNTLYTAQTP